MTVGRTALMLCALGWGLTVPAAAQQDARDWARLGYRLMARGGDLAAVPALLQALQAPPPLPDAEAYQVAADLGYALERLGRDRTAAAAFAYALAIRFDADLARARAYALLRAGRRRAADRAFAAVLAQDQALDGETRLRLRRERRALRNFVLAEAYVQLREEPGEPVAVPAGPPVVGSQGGVGVALSTRRWWPVDIRPAARLLWALEEDRLAVVAESLQAGFGVQIKPFDRTNLVLAAERLVAVGAFARDDWLLRASYSAGQGYERPPGARLWPFSALYLDAALIAPSDPDWVVSADARTGLSWQPVTGVTLRSTLIVTGIAQEGFGRTLELLEAGPGLRVILAAPGGAGRASDLALEVEARWRQRLAGDAGNRSGLTLTAVLRF